MSRSYTSSSPCASMVCCGTALLWTRISPSQNLYFQRTKQHRKAMTNIHALSGIRTHDFSNFSPVDRAAAATCLWLVNYRKIVGILCAE
jgi:hypothetical protein